MEKKENITHCLGYVGWADIESVEYKYPSRNAVKYVLRITLVGSSPRVWREIVGWEESHLSMFKKWRKEYHIYMDGADMYDYPIEDASDYALCDEKFFPAIDTAIALNELNYKM